MSKKYSLIINIAMIVIGIIGMLFYYMASKKPQYKPSQVQKVVQTKVIEAPTESITVAVAKKNLQKGTRLTSGDFQLETLKIKEGGMKKVHFQWAILITGCSKVISQKVQKYPRQF